MFLSGNILSLVSIRGLGWGDGSFYWVGCVLALHLSMGNFVKIFNSSGSAKNVWAPGNQGKLSFIKWIPSETSRMKKQSYGRWLTRIKPASQYKMLVFHLLTSGSLSVMIFSKTRKQNQSDKRWWAFFIVRP